VFTTSDVLNYRRLRISHGHLVKTNLPYTE